MMNEQLEKMVKEFFIAQVPNCEKVELKVKITDSSYAIESFVFIGEVKKQCFKMVDDGELDEKKLGTFNESFAKALRASGEYVKGKLNKQKFEVNLK